MKTSIKNLFLLSTLIASLGLMLTGRAAAQTFTTLYSFTSFSNYFHGNSDGANPQGGLILSGDILYGTAVAGGSLGNGTVFAVNTNGTPFTNLHSFAPPPNDIEELNPTSSRLILSRDTLYGTAEYGGISGWGAVFAVSTNGTAFTNLHSFTGGSDGGNPVGRLILSGNTLYGTAYVGGSSGNGTVFAVNTDGSGFTNLYCFTAFSHGPINGDGANPYAGLILSGNTLYGTTADGGSGNWGTVFAVHTNGTGFTNLHNFPQFIDGTGAQVVILSGNILYGTASGGGSSGGGTVFRINTDGTGFTNIHNFTQFMDGYGGSYPFAGLILSGNILYGTASGGGSSDDGTIFQVNTDGSGFATLYNFSKTDTNGFNSDGADPSGGLILSGNTLYGTAGAGGSGSGSATSSNYFGAVGNGTVFSLSLWPSIQYTANSANGLVPLTVQFTSAGVDSVGNAIASWNWNFGDGSTSTLQNPTHSYTTAGDFHPSFIATNNIGGPVFGFGPSITISLPTVQYAANPPSGPVRLTVQFTSPGVDSGGNAITSWTWTFGDGSTSTAENPSHTYTVAGNFYPSLIATNNIGGTVAGSGPSITVSPPAVSFTADPTNGVVPLTVQFAAAGIDSAGNAISHWTWTFGDGSTSAVQNPSHTYSTRDTFFPALIASNSIGGMDAGSGPASITTTIAPVYSGLVLNGGFETGDLTVWALSGDTSNTFVDDGSQSGIMPYSGNYEAALETTGSLGYLSQTLSTTSGANYLLSFWVDNPYEDPGEFLVSWNGNTLFDTTNLEANNWTNIQFVVSATGPSSVLQFGFEDDYDNLALDAVDVESNFLQFTATPTAGLAPLTVHFTSPSVDNDGHAITSWLWNFGDGSTSTVQSPSQVYASAGTFFPSLVATNNMGGTVPGFGPASITATTLVLNGGFEMGDFTGWTLSGDTSNTFVDDGSQSGITPYAGNYEAALGTSGSLGYLSQMLTTTPGASYSLSLWFDNPYQDPGEFLVSWNGNTLLDTTNLDVNNWTNVQFAVSATGTNTVLQVGFEDDYDVLGLDDISVLPTAAPAQYSITVSASPTSDGSASGSGTFPSGGVQTVTATANGGYAFVDWTENGTVVSSLANYTFTLNSNVTLVANFTTLRTIAFCTEIQTASSSSISYDSGLFTYTDSDASDTHEEHAILPLCGAAASLINSTNAWTASISISLSARTLTAPTSHAELGLVVSTNLSVPLSSAGFGFELVQENNTGDGDGGSTDIYPDGWYGTDLSFQAFLNDSRDPATPLGASQATGNGSIYLLLSGGTAGAGSSESIGGVSGTLTVTYSSSNQTVVGSYNGTNVASYSIAGWGANPPLALGIWGSSGKLLAVSSGTATASNFSVSAVASSGPTPLSLVTNSGAFGFTNGVFGFSISGPAGSNVVVQTTTDLRNWIPVQTNLLGNGALYFSDPQSITNRQRFYRAVLP